MDKEIFTIRDNYDDFSQLLTAMLVTYRDAQPVSLSQELRERCRDSRRTLEALELRGAHMYGISTGFGAQGDTDIPAGEKKELQNELIRYHGVGVGPLLNEGESRAVFLSRILSLSRGYSGIRPEMLDFMIDLFNRGLAPAIPSRGSVGASGDLTPLSYLAAMLCGERQAWYRGAVHESGGLFRDLGITPWNLEIKEGLALINGTAMMSALTAVSIEEAGLLADWGDRISALSAAALESPGEPFEDWVHEKKHHSGSRDSARIIREIGNLDESPIAFMPRGGNIQPPYSIRCAPQISGVLRDSIAMLRPWVARELISANDNPLFATDEERIYHTGNFYGGHMAAAADYLRIALSSSAQLIDRQVQLLLSGRNPLPVNLASDTRFGLKALGISTTALSSEIQHYAQPAGLLTRPTEGNNQDMVSMGALSALKLRQQLDLLFLQAAHGLHCALRAWWLTQGSRPGSRETAAGRLALAFADCLREDPDGGLIEKTAARMRRGLESDQE